jgi:hypothetical protein
MMFLKAWTWTWQVIELLAVTIIIPIALVAGVLSYF